MWIIVYGRTAPNISGQCSLIQLALESRALEKCTVLIPTFYFLELTYPLPMLSVLLYRTCPSHTNNGCGKREAHINWS